MPTLLLRTKSEIDDCQRHLNGTGSFGTEIESYLTQYLLVVLSAEIQQELYRMCDERAAVSGDIALSSYVGATSRKVLRSVKKDEIAGFAALFGAESKQKLNSVIQESEVVIFNNAIVSRHEVAHKQGSQVTFAELRAAVEVAEKLLSAFSDCIA